MGIFFLGEGHDEIDDENFLAEIQEVEFYLDGMKKGILPVSAGEPAKIDHHRCSRCLTCFRVCPHCSVELQDFIKPYIHPDACMGCGKCVAACPSERYRATGKS